MKKYLKLVLVVFVCLLLVGCGCSKKDKDNKKDEEKTEIKLYTTDGQLVYKVNNTYKMVFYYDDTNKITGYEHYYEYADKNAAAIEYDKAKETYKNNITIKTIKNVDKYVIYVMNDSEYEGKTVDTVKETYSYLVPVYEN